MSIKKRHIFNKKLITKITTEFKRIKEKDYITHPKESGYSAYHIILGVPVMLSHNFIYVKVEVQIRTMAMDYWASIEHKMKYKSKIKLNKKRFKRMGIMCKNDK